MGIEQRLEEKSLLWKVVVEVESAVRGERATATREDVWTIDGVNADGTYRFKVIGQKVKLRPVLEGDF
ncbi:hypothetical protein HYS82_01100 [Candidatus Amesbacteria bacterium]|nr:hypothetical protein [Candidatus Amesbacteria bacterium]